MYSQKEEVTPASPAWRQRRRCWRRAAALERRAHDSSLRQLSTGARKRRFSNRCRAWRALAHAPTGRLESSARLHANQYVENRQQYKCVHSVASRNVWRARFVRLRLWRAMRRFANTVATTTPHPAAQIRGEREEIVLLECTVSIISNESKSALLIAASCTRTNKSHNLKHDARMHFALF